MGSAFLLGLGGVDLEGLLDQLGGLFLADPLDGPFGLVDRIVVTLKHIDTPLKAVMSGQWSVFKAFS